MKKPYLTPILVISLLFAVGLALFFGIKTNQLQEQLESSKDYLSELDNRMSAQRELWEIDSLLMDGEYRQALNAYEDQYKQKEIHDGQSIEMRVALVKELLRLRYENQLSSIRQQKTEQIDSTQADGLLASEDLMLTDSLSFALEKAKVQLACLKKQLNNKSFGEYLTFTNSKGSTMHYVGQVKNGKANGFGVALLSTGSRYEGEWKDNMRHGEGTYYWSDGQYYVGEYLNDKRNGQGTYYWPNGEKYAGHWEDDERDGKGTFYGKDGEVVAAGTWEDDKLEEASKLHKGKSGS